MPKLTHEQFDEKVIGLASTYEALAGLDFKPSALTEGAVDDSVLYGGAGFYPLGSDLTRGVYSALQKLRFDVGCWGRLTHDNTTFVDEADTDKKLEISGILAMITAPKDPETFNGLALSLYGLLDNVAQGNRVVVARPGRRNYIKGVWQDDIQESGQHNGRIQVTFDNGHIGDRTISIWSDRPERTHADTPSKEGFFPQVVFPLLTVNLEDLANGKQQIVYPPMTEAAA